MPVIHSLYREVPSITIDEGACKLCGRCAEACSPRVLRMVDGRIQVNENSWFGCITCGHCMMACPEGAVSVRGRGVGPEDLRPLPAKEEMASADALAALMLSRRSIRRFKDREVEPDILVRIVDTAATAPMSIPPWDVGCVVVIGRKKIQELAGEIIKGFEGFLRTFKPWALALMRPFMGRPAYEQYIHFILPLAKKYVAAHQEGRDALFYDAPALLVFHNSPYAEPADPVLACTYAMLAAESLGLGSTIIGGAPPILQRNKPLSRSLGIPDGNKASLCLVLGYPAEHYKRAIRRRFSHLNSVT